MTILRLNPNNFTPPSRTPWGGTQISQIKKKYFEKKFPIPEVIGESWEISTDENFPSFVVEKSGDVQGKLLKEVLERENSKTDFQLLLKWIHAAESLSVQVHPTHGHAVLQNTECGKPEAWFVCANENNGQVILGLKRGVDEAQLREAISKNRIADILFSYTPKKHEYISIPPGCVHALGAGPWIVEPQETMPGKTGKTLRIFDWSRKYNTEGKADPQGEPRPLHLDEALAILDWNLPREQNFLDQFVSKLDPVLKPKFSPTKQNPFGCEILCAPQKLDICDDFIYGITVISGEIKINQHQLSCGEAAVILADENEVHFSHLTSDGVALLFHHAPQK